MPIRRLISAVVVLILTAGMATRAGAAATSRQASTVVLTFYPTTSEDEAPPVFAGDQVVLVATVSPVTGATPATGVVTFYDGSAIGTQAALHANLANSYAIAFVRFPVGTHEVTAHYSGDSSFAPRVSTPVSISVGPEPSVQGIGFQGADTEFVISAHGEGSAAQGRLVRTGTQPFVAAVTCLFIRGADAVASGVVTSGVLTAGTVVLMEGRQVGFPNDASPLDLLRYSFVPFIEPTERNNPSDRCDLPELAPVGITEGHITVTG